MKTRKHILALLLVMFTGFYLHAQQQPDQPDKIIKTYPNPAVSFVTFEFTRSYDRSYAIQIFNFTGKKMFDATNLPTRTTIPLQSFYRGVYLYRLIDRNGKVIESGKFQVVK